jgi:hypothetical protein
MSVSPDEALARLWGPFKATPEQGMPKHPTSRL